MNTLSATIYGAAESTLRWLRGYHDHQVFGLEHIPRSGPALIVFHHSLATYDSFLLGPVIKDELGRDMRGIADRLIFRTPGLGRVFTDMGFFPGTRDSALEVLAAGELLGLAPGGMRESLRSSQRRYRIDWAGRLGFVWLSVLSGCPIVLAACPRADDIYHVYENPITPLVYERSRLPAPLFRGRGISALPRPVPLRHLIAEPIYPEVAPDRAERRDVEAHQERLAARMQRLMHEALAL